MKSVRVTLCLTTLAVCIAAGCSHRANNPKTVEAVWRDMEIEISGVLKEAGDCSILEDQDGRRYGIIGDLSKYRLGDVLRIEGPVAYWATCNSYSTMRADSVQKLS